ncbi:alpha/beta family hydrolase [Nocardioides sp. AE5]|uniref:alpha/beta hydrolase family protein n=1 Tax=Nocardioides sp. AE5 TaxID=2962573 RepID=UPI0028814827|nr:alpha/beta family hydrolase [Nocardioides sp. AE5]MDT0200953.1 hydrolase [Nocardioides sp. AE5]
MPTTRIIETPHGPGRLVSSRSPSPFATLLISHGAGAGIDTHDLAALARHLPGQGITVHRFEQPWVVAGRKVATPPRTLDDGLIAAASKIRTRTPLVIGGRSAGARSACRCARDLGASGVLALSFPLHPPGKPEKSRVAELTGAGLPTLVIQGARDPMGRPEEFPGDTNLVEVPGGDHSLRVGKTAGLDMKEATALVVEAALEWIGREIGR